MKKSTTLILIAFLICAISAQAQLKFGVKGGLNLTEASVSGLNENFKTSNMAGFFVGPMAELTIPIIGIGVDASLLYNQRGTKFTSNSKSVTNTQHALDIPINLKYSIGMGSMASVFFAAGPSFSFKLSGDDYLKDLSSIASEVTSSGSAKENAVQAGVNIGAGVKLLKHFQVGANYHLPLSKSFKESLNASNLLSGNTFESKNKGWQVSVAYIF